MAKRNAFTLAEVLITLGIIGVVAAMTLPTLMNSTQAAQFRSQFKKTLSVASQAIVVTVALDDYDAGQANATTGGTNSANNGEFFPSLYNMFNRRLNVVGREATGDITATPGYTFTWGNSALTGAQDANYTFYLNDGSTLSFPNTATQCTEANPCRGIIDVNGSKMPNRLIACDNGVETDAGCRSERAGDIFPVRIFDQQIVPATRAGRYVLYKGSR